MAQLSSSPKPSVRRVSAGIALAWFLLFPSLGVVQKYFGPAVILAYLGIGALSLIGVLVGTTWLQPRPPAHERAFRWASAALLSAMALALLFLYPVANAKSISWVAPSGIAGGGSDRDEALNLGVRALLAGRNPYSETTQLANPISPMPGTLILAVPFVAFGNVAWQNLAWFAVLLASAARLLGEHRTAVMVLGSSLLASPVMLQEFVTGGDLVTNSIIVLVALLLLWDRIPDPARSAWSKIAAALFAGVAFSSRGVFLLLLPLVFAMLTRRAGLRQAIVYFGIAAAAFSIVTLPFYWQDPAAFAPLRAQNPFRLLEAGIPGSRWLFPGLSVAFAAGLSRIRGDGTLGLWLLQCGLVLTFPIAVFVILTSALSRWPSFMFSSYALTGLVFGTLGAVLYSRHGHPAQTVRQVM